MNSEKLARYIEATDVISKPGLLAPLRLKKRPEDRENLLATAYEAALKDIHTNLINPAEGWIGQEDEVFG
jgi:hypothetical protein